MVITPTFDGEQVARFGFSPILNIIQSAQMQQYVNLYDQVRFQGFTLKLIPSIPNAEQQYAVFYRWMRDDVPITAMQPQAQQDSILARSHSKGLIYSVAQNIDITASGSTQVRYLNPQTQNYIKTKIYPATIQEKSVYVGTHRVASLMSETPAIEQLNSLDQLLQFCPWLLVQVSNQANNNSYIQWIIELEADCIFRGTRGVMTIPVQPPQPALDVKPYITAMVSPNGDQSLAAYKVASIDASRVQALVQKAGRDLMYGYVTALTDKDGLPWSLMDGAAANALVALSAATPKDNSLQGGHFAKENNFNRVPIAQADYPNAYTKGVVAYVTGHYFKQEQAAPAVEAAQQGKNDEAAAKFIADQIEPQRLANFMQAPFGEAPEEIIATYSTMVPSLTISPQMIGGNSEIHAVGYIDAMANPDDEAGGVSQDPEGYNRVGWTSVNGVTTPAAIQELNLTHTGPMFVEEASSVVDIPAFNLNDVVDYYYVALASAPTPNSVIDKLWVPMSLGVPELTIQANHFHGLPKGQTSTGDYVGDPWNSQFDDNIVVQVFDIEGMPVLHTKPGASIAVGSSMFYLRYSPQPITYVGGFAKRNLMVTFGYSGGPIDIHRFRDTFLWALGLTSQPLQLAELPLPDVDPLILNLGLYNLLSGPEFERGTPEVKLRSEILTPLMSHLSSNMQGLLTASKFITRVKGFFVKAVKFVKNKVLPIFKQVAPLVQPLIPGITPILVGINALDKSPAVTSTVKCSAVAKTNALGSFKDSTGDYFKLTMQVRLCELDSNDEPIYIDTIANNDYNWQNASEPFRYFVNAADQPPQQTSVVNIEFSNGKFAERYASYVSAGKPIHYQIRYKVEFDKTNVPVDYKAVLTYDMSVGTVEVTEEDRALFALAEVAQ